MNGLAEQVYPDPKRLVRCLIPCRGEALYAGIGAVPSLARSGRVSRLWGTAFSPGPRLTLINLRVEPGARLSQPRLPDSMRARLKMWAMLVLWHGFKSEEVHVFREVAK